jgi:DNA repair exonuclease SbcCD nuclease subunit
MTLTFIHAADLHLDSPFQGLTHLPTKIFEEVCHSTFHAFDRLIQMAITKQVDFLLLTGDLFDHESQSLKAQVHLRTGFQQLHDHQIQVYLSYGNHDYIHGDYYKVIYPDNVHIFPNETITSFIFEKNRQQLARITGFSYEGRSVSEEKITAYPEKGQDVPYHIGMLHGSLYGDKAHDTYAPFRLQQLLDKEYDYWALGHIHKRVQLNNDPPVIYPGNTQGRHLKETGEKGCYYVQLTETETKATFIPLQAIQFKAITVDLAKMETFEAIESDVINQISHESDSPFLIHLTWENVEEHQYTEGFLHEIVDIINDKGLDHSPWRFIYQTQVIRSADVLPSFNPLFVAELEKACDTIVVKDELHALTNHAQARKFLDMPCDGELVMGAKALLAELLQMKEADS